MVNVDTDMIIPEAVPEDASSAPGLARACSPRCATTADGSEKPDFVLNQAGLSTTPRSWSPATISAAARRREHAPWALLDFGIRCVISTSFADIFYNNCFKNGILPHQGLAQGDLDKLIEDAEPRLQRHPHRRSRDAGDHAAPTAARSTSTSTRSASTACSNGLDDIGLTMVKEKAIGQFETTVSAARPWL